MDREDLVEMSQMQHAFDRAFDAEQGELRAVAFRGLITLDQTSDARTVDIGHRRQFDQNVVSRRDQIEQHGAQIVGAVEIEIAAQRDDYGR